MGAEGVDGREHDRRPVSDQFAPVRTLRAGDRDGRQTEGAAARIGSDQKLARAARAEIRMVVDVVFVVVFALGDELEFAEGCGRGEETDFAGGVAVRDQQKIAAAARAFDVDAEAFVGLFVEKRVGFG
jgi:hypothetical protein